MIFQHTFENVLNQQKNQTRRVIKPSEYAVRSRHNKIHAVHNGRKKWEVGQIYAVQPARGKPAIARIRITQINSEYITRIRTKDAIKEGFCNRQEFLSVWQTIHGENSLRLRVWVLHFELVDITIGVYLSVNNFVQNKKSINYAYNRFDSIRTSLPRTT